MKRSGDSKVGMSVQGISPFLQHPESSLGWEEGMAKEVYSLMMTQKEEALLLREQIKEQIQEQTSAPTETLIEDTQER